MRIKFIYPKFTKYLEQYPELDNFLEPYNIGNYTMPPALGIPILKALTPSNHSTEFIDQNIEEVNFDDPADIVAISYFTPQAGNGYKIGDEYLKRGVKVVMGGMHPTSIPEDAKKHSTSVVIGEAEELWTEVLKDAENNNLKEYYKPERFPPLELMPVPDRTIFKKEKYFWQSGLVQVARGCSFNCIACNVPLWYGNKIRYRPIENIIEDVENLGFGEFYLTDDTIMLHNAINNEFAIKLFKSLKPLKTKVFISSTLSLNSDPEYLKILHSGGAVSLYTVFGFDPLSIKLFKKNCSEKIKQKALDIVKSIEDSGIHFFGSFGLGFDRDDEGVFDRILEFSKKAKINLAEFFIATPYPNTLFWKRVTESNRLLNTDWIKYNGANVVFKPLKMAEDKLLDGYFYMWKEFYNGINPEDTNRSFTLNPDAKGGKNGN